MKKDVTASMAPARVVADGGRIKAGGSGPVKGIRIAGVVIRDASCSAMSWRVRSRAGSGQRLRRRLKLGTKIDDTREHQSAENSGSSSERHLGEYQSM